ncbi:MAG: hypothetical protein U0271_21675 [Polyangiaceae bacterium]
MAAERSLALLLTSICAFACSTPTPPSRTTKATAPEEVPVNALEAARAAVDGRTGALLHISLLRSILSAESTLRLGQWGQIAQRLGLDPLRDVDTVFVTSTHALDARSAVVIKTSAEPSYLLSKLEAAAVESGALLSTPVGDPPRASLRLKDGSEVTVAIGDVIVALPSYVGFEVDRFAGPVYMPGPFGTEAASFFAFDLSSTLGSIPRWPTELVAAQAFLELDRSGGATIRFDGRTLSHADAERSALSLTQQAHDLLTVNLKLFELELLTPPVFSANDERVEMTTTLSAEELGWLLAFSGSR